MSICRLDIERVDTLWIIAHDERGAIEMATAHIVGEAIDAKARAQLTRDGDETLVLCAEAGRWPDQPV